ncbi:Wzz/FepE/Etk N-terminal domain-containing protein [Sphingobacterium spiritivorum]|uniref:Wzz/FepE/Etk N-terminal domain-containing protein n=1 Tax=Sphingobacterium spiritivorum TaxID=258 RepID=UPI003DA6A928
MTPKPNHTLPNASMESEGEELNLKALFEQYLYYWKWFIISVFVVLTLAFLYLRYTPKQYAVDAKILLPDEKSSKGELAGLSDLAEMAGSSATSSQVMDQIDVLKSRRLVSKVVDRLNLSTNYSVKGRLTSQDITEQESTI